MLHKFYYLIIFILFCFTNTCWALGKLININGTTTLWVEQYGSGKPTVILINGGGDSIDTEWTNIIPALSKVTSVIAYDRPGQGQSPASLDMKSPRAAKEIVATLCDLLFKLKVKPPYMLVAHSIGGLYAQYFARNYPNEIVGLVTINSNLVAEQNPKKVSWLSPSSVQEIIQYNNHHEKKLKQQLATTLKNIHGNPTKEQAAQIEYSLEVMGKRSSIQQIQHSPPLSKNLILADLVSGNNAIEIKMHKEFSGEVPNAIFKIFPNSSHYIQNDDPKAVINIIMQVIERYVENNEK